MSKASASAPAAGKVLPGYAELAAAARDARASGRAMFPLSGVHLMELSKVKDPSQRADVAAAMEDLSGFNYLLDRLTLARLEMDAGLDRLYGEAQPLARLPPCSEGHDGGTPRSCTDWSKSNLAIKSLSFVADVRRRMPCQAHRG